MDSSMKYSVLVSVYKGADPAAFKVSMHSIFGQTVAPNEIVLVEDGPITAELDRAIQDCVAVAPCPFNIVSYDTNRGLAYALTEGIKHCAYPLVARMDADDISARNRIELELNAMKSDPSLDMVGSQIIEFTKTPADPVSLTSLPLSDVEIKRFSKKRDPFRHPTMLMKKESIIAAGSYQPDYLYFEDWDLFNRMLASGCKARNLDIPLVAVRAGDDFFSRRGGIKYLKHAWKFKRDQYKNGYFSIAELLTSFFPQAAVCLMPNFLRSYIYTNLLRSKPKNVSFKYHSER